MNLLIIENTHSEVLEGLIYLLKKVNRGINIFVLVTPNVDIINSNIKLCRQVFISKKINLSNDDIIEICKNVNIDLVIYGTIDDVDYARSLTHLRCLSQNHIRTLLILHNVYSFYLFPKLLFQKSQSPRGFASSLVLYIKNVRYYLIKKKIRNFISGVGIICKTQYKLVSALSKGRPIIYLPAYIGRLNIETRQVAFANQFIIAIPGSIDIRRRDYKIFFDLVSLLTESRKKYVLHFLGSPVNLESVELAIAIKNLSNNNVLIWCRTEIKRISNTEFTNGLKQCSVVLCPLQKSINYQGYFEEYGVSKSSGSFYDLLIFQKTGLFPADIPTPAILDSFVRTYKDVFDLSNKIIEMNSFNVSSIKRDDNFEKNVGLELMEFKKFLNNIFEI